MAKSETSIQIQFIQRLKVFYPGLARLIFAIPNGGKRDAKTAMILKNMGVTGGVPDVFVAVPRGEWHGLFVELKKPGGRLSDDQEATIAQLEDVGYAVVVCDSVESAWSLSERYLDGYNTPTDS